MSLILLAHSFSCWFMTGVIWIVQLLVYPNFQFIRTNQFKQFHEFHLQRITWIVAPLMLIELLTAAWMAYQSISILTLANMGTVVLLWILTAAVNVPAHNNLKFEDPMSKKNLVFKNWPRTILWTLRSIAMFCLIFAKEL